jgi:glycosyltransferase involved in cell wall biosynthesis
MPFLKNIPPGMISSVLAIPLVRKVFHAVVRVYVRVVTALQGFSQADVYFVSNLHAVPYLSSGWRIVYDMNDHHLAFENTPPWLSAQFGELCAVASRIVISCRALAELCFNHRSKVHYIGNGVDSALFGVDQMDVHGTIGRLYTGAISEIVDFDLLEMLLERLGHGQILTMVGPVFPSVRYRMDRLLSVFSNHVRWVSPQPQTSLRNYVAKAEVCLIPFVSSPLTKYANPNKAYEYLACGKPVVATGASAALEEMKDVLFVANDLEEFVRLALHDYSNEAAAVRQRRREYARNNDWSAKAAQYAELIRGLCIQ